MNVKSPKRGILLGICAVVLSLLLIAGYTAPVLATPGPVFWESGESATFDENQVSHPWVIKDGTTYKMWYVGWDGEDHPVGIGYATSPDGIHWSRHTGSEYGGSVLSVDPGIGWDNSGIFTVCVLKNTTEQYEMWYTGFNHTNPILTHGSIGYATSDDGETWTKYTGTEPGGAVLAPDGAGFDGTHVYAPSVIKEAPTTYYMWYTGIDFGYASIGYATSSDGITWGTRVRVMDLGGEGDFDEFSLYAPCVILNETNDYEMWYSGYDGTHASIGYAMSDDRTTWTGRPQQVLDSGASGMWDDGDLESACVINSTSRMMWYTGDDEPGDGPPPGTKRIGHAISDDGIDWTRIIIPEFQIGSLGFLTMLALTMGVAVPVAVRLVYKNRRKEKAE